MTMAVKVRALGYWTSSFYSSTAWGRRGGGWRGDRQVGHTVEKSIYFTSVVPSAHWRCWLSSDKMDALFCKAQVPMQTHIFRVVVTQAKCMCPVGLAGLLQLVV